MVNYVVVFKGHVSPLNGLCYSMIDIGLVHSVIIKETLSKHVKGFNSLELDYFSWSNGRSYPPKLLDSRPKWNTQIALLLSII